MAYSNLSLLQKPLRRRSISAEFGLQSPRLSLLGGNFSELQFGFTDTPSVGIITVTGNIPIVTTQTAQNNANAWVNNDWYNANWYNANWYNTSEPPTINNSGGRHSITKLRRGRY